MQQLQEGIAIKGRIKIRKYKAGTKELLWESDWSKNLVMFGTNTGRDLILKRLSGDNTYTLNILHADIGTDNTAPAITDTQLGAAVARASSPTVSQAGAVISFLFFWPDGSLTNGTYNEFGAFVDGTTAINTGRIFERALFTSSYVKGAGEDTTVQLDITVS